jgi:D-sedoheptulose 7-phosphate isomerase|tara:strand:+ start:74 stop:679 length:606 start_codon:yes stop_codon:yes gene_type:complete
MKTLKHHFKESKNFKIFAKKYIDYLSNSLKNLDLDSLDEIRKELEIVKRKKKTIFVFGNGGAAATALTIANDLGFDIMKKSKSKKTFNIVCLNENQSVITAIANDTGYENIFLNQLKIKFTKGDVAIILSASGNSNNLIKAAKWLKGKGKVFALLGFDGGKLLNYCNKHILIKSLKSDYGPVEDIQLVINHIFAHWFQNKF